MLSRRILIAVMSCNDHRRTHKACRETWLTKTAPNIDYKFFVGHGSSSLDKDEEQVDATDDYLHVTEKSRKIFELALARGYDYILHVGRDTYVHLPRLDQAELEPTDYAGNCALEGWKPQWTKIDFPLPKGRYTDISSPDGKGRYAYTCGGAGTWLSRRAMQEILNSDMYHEADDLLYGWILGSKGIRCWHDLRFQRYGHFLFRPNHLTVHLSRGTGSYNPLWMYNCHRKSEALWP